MKISNLLDDIYKDRDPDHLHGLADRDPAQNGQDLPKAVHILKRRPLSTAKDQVHPKQPHRPQKLPEKRQPKRTGGSEDFLFGPWPQSSNQYQEIESSPTG